MNSVKLTHFLLVEFDFGRNDQMTRRGHFGVTTVFLQGVWEGIPSAYKKLEKKNLGPNYKNFTENLGNSDNIIKLHYVHEDNKNMYRTL